MTPRQRRFVDEYLIDLRCERAGRRAGYSRSTAQTYCKTLLHQPEIAAAVATAMAERSRRTGITAERVLDELARIAFVDWRKLADWGPRDASVLPSVDLSPRETAAIATVGADKESGRVAVVTYDKKRALEVLARIFGLCVDPSQTAGRP